MPVSLFLEKKKVHLSIVPFVVLPLQTHYSKNFKFFRIKFFRLNNGQRIWFACDDCKQNFLFNLENSLNSTTDAIPESYFGSSLHCPVTGDPITVDQSTAHITWNCGQITFFCCEDCIKSFVTDISKYVSY